jgi:stage IV sporulation protein FB
MRIRLGKYTTLEGVRPLGAEFRVHWSVFFVGGLLLLGGIDSPITSLLALASYLSIIVVHELGHAIMARSVGCGVEAITLGFFHGTCRIEAPYDLWDHVKIAWAGSFAQLALAVIAYTPVLLFPSLGTGAYSSVIIFLVYFNILFALLNLVPACGLDGRSAWQVIPLLRQYLQARSASRKALARFNKK